MKSRKVICRKLSVFLTLDTNVEKLDFIFLCLTVAVVRNCRSLRQQWEIDNCVTSATVGSHQNGKHCSVHTRSIALLKGI